VRKRTVATDNGRSDKLTPQRQFHAPVARTGGRRLDEPQALFISFARAYPATTAQILQIQSNTELLLGRP
jgi:hypothetical protein